MTVLMRVFVVTVLSTLSAALASRSAAAAGECTFASTPSAMDVMPIRAEAQTLADAALALKLDAKPDALQERAKKLQQHLAALMTFESEALALADEALRSGAKLDSLQEPAKKLKQHLAALMTFEAKAQALAEAAAKSGATPEALRDPATKLKQHLDALATLPPSTLTLEKSRRIAIHLANPPPTRLRLSFDSVQGRHVEVEWDPTVTSELGRTVTLEPDTWRIVATVEPSTYTQNSGSVIIHTRFDAIQVIGDGTKARLDGMYVALVAALNVPEGASERAMPQWPRPQLSFACVELPSMESSQFAPAPAANGGGGLRGFGVAPSVVTDTLSILAEIAVKRAKAGAMRLLTKRLIDPFCTDAGTKVTLAKLDMGFSDELALPRTCELLTSLRLDDILSSGRPLLIALRDDLRRTVAPATVTRLAGTDALADTVLQSVLTLINGAIDHGGIDTLDSQLALELLGNVEKLGAILAPEILQNLDEFIEKNLLAADYPTFKTALKLTCDQNCSATIRAELKKLLRTPIKRCTAVC